MPESGPFGSVRGVPGNGHPYRDPRPQAVIRGQRGNFRKRSSAADLRRQKTAYSIDQTSNGQPVGCDQ